MFSEFPYDECPHCKTKSLMVEWGPAGVVVYVPNAARYETAERGIIKHCTNCDYTDQTYLQYKRDSATGRESKLSYLKLNGKLIMVQMMTERCMRCSAEFSQPLVFEDEENREEVWACPSCNYIFPLGLSFTN